MKTFTPHPLIIPKLLDGSATQIRIPMDPQPSEMGGTPIKIPSGVWFQNYNVACQNREKVWDSPFGQSGDELVCLEEFRYEGSPTAFDCAPQNDKRRVIYSDDPLWGEVQKLVPSTSSMFYSQDACTMLPEYSRLSLHVERVWVTQVQMMLYSQRIAMGLDPSDPHALELWVKEWDTMYPDYPYASNLYVFAAKVRIEMTS